MKIYFELPDDILPNQMLVIHHPDGSVWHHISDGTECNKIIVFEDEEGPIGWKKV